MKSEKEKEKEKGEDNEENEEEEEEEEEDKNRMTQNPKSFQSARQPQTQTTKSNICY